MAQAVSPGQTSARPITIAGGRTVGLREWGRPDGAIALLLHGLSDNSATWRLVGPLLGERYRVLALDARGHGDSDWSLRYDMDFLAEDVIAVMDAVGALGAILVGHSMGAATACEVAFGHPERVRALVLEDAPSLSPAQPKREPPTGPRLGDTHDWRAEVAMARWRNDPPQDWWRKAKEIRCQTLVVGGRRSHLPQQDLKRFAKAVPRGTYVSLDTDHSVHRAVPGTFAATVMPFLAGAVR